MNRVDLSLDYRRTGRGDREKDAWCRVILDETK